MKRFEVDLSKLFIKDQWDDVLGSTQYLEKARKLSVSAYNDILGIFDEDSQVGVDIITSTANFFKRFFRIKGRFLREMKVLSQYTGTKKEVFLGNMSYEILKTSSNLTNLTWCSSIGIDTKYGPVLSRNLDWPLPELKDSTIEIDFHGAPAGSFTAITFPGFSGILTGIAPGRFAASVNMMVEDQYGVNLRGTPICFVLREMFETCEDFDDAVEFLENADVFAPGFVHIVGVENGENNVVGLMTKEYENFTYEADSDGLCVTNHIPDSDFDDDENEVDSVERLEFADSILPEIDSFQEAVDLMTMEPMLNEETKHTVTMCPATEEYSLN